MPAETFTAARWLYAKLAGDAALAAALGGADRVWQELADQGSAMPYVVFQYQGGSDVAGVGTARIMANLLYLVRVVGGGAHSELEAAADRIDAVLHGASGPVGDGIVFACVREQPISYTETSDGKVYRHVGGLYRLFTQSA